MDSARIIDEDTGAGTVAGTPSYAALLSGHHIPLHAYPHEQVALRRVEAQHQPIVCRTGHRRACGGRRRLRRRPGRPRWRALSLRLLLGILVLLPSSATVSQRR